MFQQMQAMAQKQVHIIFVIIVVVCPCKAPVREKERERERESVVVERSGTRALFLVSKQSKLSRNGSVHQPGAGL